MVKFFTCLSERALDLRLRLMLLVRDLIGCLSTMDCLYPRDLPAAACEEKKPSEPLWSTRYLEQKGVFQRAVRKNKGKGTE